ncbi:hypothetical protein [Photobacterium piscicola]
MKKKQCYELLYFLALSVNGEYMIQYYHEKNTLFPTLVTTTHV